jgi:hypothetical protein
MKHKTNETKGKYDVEVAKKEHAALRQYAAIQKAAEEKVSVQKIYVDIAGNLEAAFVLDELIYFTLPRENGMSGLRVRKDGFLWMAVSRTEWWDRKRITAKQADGAIDRLVKSGLVIKELHLFNKQKTTHLRLNVPEFFKRYMELLEKENPPEDEGNTTARDISALYEMMGIPKGDTPEIEPPEKEEGIPERDTASLNGDSLNTPHSPLTQPPFDEDLADPSWAILGNKKITKGSIYKRKELQDFENMLEVQFKRFPLNWTAFDGKAKDNFRRFIRDLPAGQSLEQFVNWWMADERRASSPPYTLAIIMQRWPQAFTVTPPAQQPGAVARHLL